MQDNLLARVNERIAYVHSLVSGCQTLYRFTINEICPASWEDRWVDISALMDTRRRYEAELCKYQRRLNHYQRLKNKVLGT